LTSPAPSAATISVRETLELLDGPFAEVAAGVGQDRYALWLGSGISWARVEDLKGVIKRVLAHLRDNADLSDPTCRFRKALNEALSLAQLSAGEQAGLDFTRSIDDWPSLPTILERLATRYASLLDIRIEHEAPDYLLWDVVDVRATFAAVSPDCEHFLIGILAIEGVISDIVSSNWDGLIEAAVLELSGTSNGVLRVCVRSLDLRAERLRSRLIKIHGCAIRAAEDPTLYRELLVGRLSQITSWQYEPAWTAIRNDIVALAVTKPTLMIGLSAQDTDIQDVFAAAQATMQWKWPSHPPANVFAEQSLGNAQRNILRCVYRDAYDAHTAQIEAESTLRAYGKPLLTALVLHVLCAKLSAFAHLANSPGLDEATRDALGSGIVHLRNRVADGAAPMDCLKFARLLIQASSRAMSLFQEGSLPPKGKWSYRALGAVPVSQIAAEPNLTTSGLREMASALGLLGLGEGRGDWYIELGDSSSDRDGVILVSAPGTRDASRLFFVANSNAAFYLADNNIVKQDDGDAVVIHSAAPAQPMPRAPRSAPGRTGRRVARNVDMAALLREATDMDNLRQRFRIAASL